MRHEAPWLTSRILGWTYSAAYRCYQNRPILPWLITTAISSSDSGTRSMADFGMVGVDGTLLRPGKQIYGQAFGIYALAEYYAATGREEALQRAQAIFRLWKGTATTRLTEDITRPSPETGEWPPTCA